MKDALCITSCDAAQEGNTIVKSEYGEVSFFTSVFLSWSIFYSINLTEISKYGISIYIEPKRYNTGWFEMG